MKKLVVRREKSHATTGKNFLKLNTIKKIKQKLKKLKLKIKNIIIYVAFHCDTKHFFISRISHYCQYVDLLICGQ